MDHGDLYFTVSTAGHVDHGKTSVLKRLTGIDTDRLKEEKQRQMTTDLGFAHLSLPAPQSFGEGAHFQVGFIDVPGHGKFLKNMIAGVGALDMALLVVAADEGPMPQTLQHIEILSLLGVKKVLLVVNKSDLAKKESLPSTIAALADLLAKYDLEMVEAIPVSCVTDSGFEELKAAIAKCLAAIPSRTISMLGSMPVYLPVDRAFSMVGHGLVVTGTLVRGSVRQGDSVLLEPAGLKARVRGLETFGHTIEQAHPGQRLAINLAVKEHEKVKRGQAVLGDPVSETKTLLVSLELFFGSKGQSEQKQIKSQPVRFYHGTADIGSMLGFAQAMSTDKEHRKQSFLAQITLEEPLIAEPSERYVVRFGDDQMAGGAILFKARPKWLNRSLLIDFSKLLAAARYEDAALWFAQNSPQQTVTKEALALFLPVESRRSVIKSLVEKGQLMEVGDFLLSREVYEEIKKQALTKLSELEAAANDLSKRAGIASEQLRAAMTPVPERTVLANAIDDLVSSGRLLKEGEKLCSPQAKQRVQSAKANPQTLTAVEEVLAKNVCIEADALSTLCRAKQSEIDRALEDLESEGKARRIAHEFVCSTKALDLGHSVLASLWQEKKEITPSEFKERMKITRKYAMAMLSHFDDAQITRRVGNGRVLLKAPKS